MFELIIINNNNNNKNKNWTKARKNKSIIKKANVYCEENNMNYDELKTQEKNSRKLNLKMSFHATHENKYTEMPLHGQHEGELNQPYIDKDLSRNGFETGNSKQQLKQRYLLYKNRQLKQIT